MPHNPTPPATSPPPPPAPAVPPDDWPIRVLALVPLMAIGLLWSNHHLGLGAGQPALMASIAAVVPVALGVFTQLLDKDQHTSLLQRLRGHIARRLTWRVLAILYLALGTVALTWTSVVILAEDGSRLGRVALHALDNPAAAADLVAPQAKGEPARFVIASHPFGRPFRVELEGFVPKVVEVYPLVGLRLRPSIDLRRSPSVLLRFSGVAKGSWNDVGGAELRIVAVGVAGDDKLIANVKEPAGALLLGRGQPVPASWSSQWQTELLAKGVTDQTQAARELLSWKQPRVLPLASGLEPGMQLRVTLVNEQKNVIARAEFFIGKDELQDQSLEDIE